ncbi:hypothetical protein psyc5s11_30240 [Clostridium gelidum]|uniref:Uncharacterized protein n=1 Tax=Clostridium gelidum TaxID=704125 RepID=A0ABM7T6Q5_9CLOT|nr:hypothetical protein [Clostridium gelidum]BCZ46957.1 hypothetical protein psyc5s11_30240 [Clostridium gelidum]
MIQWFLSDPIMMLITLLLIINTAFFILRMCEIKLNLLIAQKIYKVLENKKYLKYHGKAYALFKILKSLNDIKIYSKFQGLSTILITLSGCIISIELIYGIIHIVIYAVSEKINLGENACNYLSLTVFLMCIAYYPEKVVLMIQSCTLKIFRITLIKMSELIDDVNKSIIIYKKAVILLRPKLWMYFISIFMTVLNSLEKISGMKILNYSLWLQIKPIVIEAVFTMIVIDRFVNLFKSEYKKIKFEVKEISNTDRQSEII